MSPYVWYPVQLTHISIVKKKKKKHTIIRSISYFSKRVYFKLHN